MSHVSLKILKNTQKKLLKLPEFLLVTRETRTWIPAHQKRDEHVCCMYEISMYNVVIARYTERLFLFIAILRYNVSIYTFPNLESETNKQTKDKKQTNPAGRRGFSRLVCVSSGWILTL